MKVPFLDLSPQADAIRNRVTEKFGQLFQRCDFVLGEDVRTFESRFAEYCGTTYALGVANGTDAIHLALRAVGIGPGDEVILPANTFIATAIGVTCSGAKPVLVDADPGTFLMDLDACVRAITPRTKAILPVHLFGRMLDPEALLEIKTRYAVPVIEDTAQAHGAAWKGRKAGATGIAGCFSFFPAKNLGCFGDGGMVVTSSEAVKNHLEALRNYGSPRKYHHPVFGINSRLDTFQASVLDAKLAFLDGWNEKRRTIAAAYQKGLRGVGDIVCPEIPSEPSSHVFHLYVIRTKKRTELQDYLTRAEIGTLIHYPTPIHLQGAFAHLGYETGSFPVSEQLAGEILSLPLFPGLKEPQIHHVIATIREFFDR